MLHWGLSISYKDEFVTTNQTETSAHPGDDRGDRRVSGMAERAKLVHLETHAVVNFIVSERDVVLIDRIPVETRWSGCTTAYSKVHGRRTISSVGSWRGLYQFAQR